MWQCFLIPILGFTQKRLNCVFPLIAILIVLYHHHLSIYFTPFQIFVASLKLLRSSNLHLSLAYDRFSLRFKKSNNFIVVTKWNCLSCEMNNIVKGPISYHWWQILRITFLNDKPPLESQSDQRTNWITQPPDQTRAIFNILTTNFGLMILFRPCNNVDVDHGYSSISKM